MSRFNASVTKPRDVSVTMTMTLSMAEWAAIREALNTNVPGQPYAVTELSSAIRSLAWDMAKVLSYTPPPSDEKEPAA